MRTPERMKTQGKTAEKNGTGTSMGVKSVSVVHDLPHFDISKGLPPDYMHALLLGIVRAFMILWFFIRGRWFCGSYISNIDTFLKAIKVPDFIRRHPRSVESSKKWKASEFRNWLLFWSLPIMSEYLPDDYKQHWMELVLASYLILQDRISPRDLEVAHELFRSFSRKIRHLYRMQEYKYNLHQLLHFKMMVENWGPAWGISTFMFENYNGILRKMIHGTKHQGKELANNLRIVNGIQILKNIVHRQRTESPIPNCILGKPFFYEFNLDQMEAMQTLRLADYSLYKKAQVKKNVLSSEIFETKRRNRRLGNEGGNEVKSCNSYVSYLNSNNETNYGRIFCFLKNNQHSSINCLIKKFIINPDKYFVISESVKIEHIIPIQESNDYELISIENIVDKMIRVKDYLCIRPNSVETNL